MHCLLLMIRDFLYCNVRGLLSSPGVGICSSSPSWQPPFTSVYSVPPWLCLNWPQLSHNWSAKLISARRCGQVTAAGLCKLIFRGETVRNQCEKSDGKIPLSFSVSFKAPRSMVEAGWVSPAAPADVPVRIRMENAGLLFSQWWWIAEMLAGGVWILYYWCKGCGNIWLQSGRDTVSAAQPYQVFSVVQFFDLISSHRITQDEPSFLVDMMKCFSRIRNSPY